MCRSRLHVKDILYLYYISVEDERGSWETSLINFVSFHASYYYREPGNVEELCSFFFLLLLNVENRDETRYACCGIGSGYLVMVVGSSNRVHSTLLDEYSV